MRKKDTRIENKKLFHGSDDDEYHLTGLIYQFSQNEAKLILSVIFITLLTTILVTIFIIPDNSKKLYEGLKRKLLICDTWLLTKSVPNPPQTHRHTRIWWWIFVFCCILHSVSRISDLESVWCFPIANTRHKTASSRAAPHQDNWSQSSVLSPCKTCLITINKICTVVSSLTAICKATALAFYLHL